MRLPVLPGREADLDERLPLPPFPAGWFGLTFSHELSRGEVKSVRFAGRELVVFRTHSGEVAAFEAHCPHLGAHFGHGGRVEGETLRCPMHGFRFSPEGACVAVGACHSKPPSARAGVVPTRELNGVVLAWHHPEGAPPSWEPPPLVEGAAAEGPAQRWRLTVRTHPQELAENLFDVAHLVAVHRYEDPTPAARPAVEGHVIRGDLSFYQRTELRGVFSRRVHIELRNALHGLGVILFDSVAQPGGLSFRGAFTARPVARGEVDFMASVWVRDIDAGLAATPVFRSLPRALQLELMGRLLALGMKRDMRDDRDVLDHKRHLTRPGLSDGDGPIPVFRRWARQFYPATLAVAPEARAPGEPS